MSECIISIKNLVKKYKDKTLFNNVNLEINKGESIALVGNNGMGKSTMLKMIAHLTKIDEGEIVYDKNLKFNYIPEKFPPLNLKVCEYIKLIGDIENLDSKEFEERTNYLYNAFNITTMINTPMKYLSKGSLQKVSVIQAFLSKPDVLLLDEPLSGQDYNSQRTFIKMVQDLIKENVTVIMSCHEIFLINELSTKILEVKDYNLIEIPKESFRQTQYSFIEVCKNKNTHLKIDELKRLYDVTVDNEIIKIKVDRNKSNYLLKQLIESEFIIKKFDL